MKSFFILFFCFCNLSYAGINPTDILAKSDFYRGNFADGFTWKVTVSSQEDGEKEVKVFQVYSKGNNSLAEALSPARNKGESYLFNDRNMWFFKPTLKKPISISVRQRLSGQASNGDIATTHYARDYSANYEKNDKVNNNEVVVLLLTSKDKNTTYDKIRYYVSTKNNRALKADFLSVQGSLLKSALFEYANNVSIGGKNEAVISKMTISDAFNKENISTLEYETPKIVSFSDSKFNVNSLGR